MINQEMSIVTSGCTARHVKPTGGLRFVRRFEQAGNDNVERKVLQQEWVITEYSGFNPSSQSLEWRDVPLVDAE